MKYVTKTKNSIKVVSDEKEMIQRIKKGVKLLGNGYEFKLVEVGFILAVEFYLNYQNKAEKDLQTREIFEVLGLK